MDIFSALKKIFSTGLIVNDVQNQKIRVIDTQRSQAYSRRNTFFDKLQRNQIQNSSMVQNYSLNRVSLYRDYDMMDCDALMSSALDVYVFQSLTKDEYGQIMKITAEDQQIVEILTELFYERLNCQFNFNVWFRNFVKYGDFFLALRIDDEHGIIGCQPISPYDIERVQGEDYDNPDTYYFRMLAGGNQLIDNYNIAHFRLLNDTNFLPYGRSTLQPARRIWKNFSLMVDAMMIQRIMRAPERRVFKVDVGDIPNDEVGPFMQDVINKMKKVPYKDPVTGEINLKYNMQNLLEDFFIPVRGNQDGSTVETLAGMENSFTDDIAFIKSYMMAALKIPKAFLTFQQGIQAKCFAPYTRIKLLDGRILTLQDLSKIYEEMPDIALQTLTYDFDLKMFIPTNIKWCSKTRLDAQIVRVYLDNDTHVDVTPDHNFILSDGNKKMAKDLLQNDSLLRFDIEYSSGGYPKIYQPMLRKYVDIHKVIDNHNNGQIIKNGYNDQGKFNRKDIIVIHHKDFDKENNSSDNLQRMTFQQHGNYHSKMVYNFLRPESIQKRIKALGSQQVRKKMSNSLKNSKKAQIARKKLIQKNRLPENRKYNSDIVKKYLQNNHQAKYRLRNIWQALTHQEKSNIVKKTWDNAPQSRHQVSRNCAKKNLTTKEARQKSIDAIKHKYPGQKFYFWAKGQNSKVWVKRPSMQYLHQIANSLTYNPTFGQFSKQCGFNTPIILKQIIYKNGISVQQFLNDHFGFRHGRKKDISLQIFINLIQYSKDFNSLYNNYKYPLGVRALSRLLINFNLSEEWLYKNIGIKYNHKVIKVQHLPERMDTYNLQVQHKDHNILLYDNGIVVKQSTLSQLDIIFARYIENLQSLFINQLYRVALIHLFVLGYTDFNEVNFKLQLNNPSNVKKLQELQLWERKLQIGKKMQQTMHFNLGFIYENIYDQSQEEKLKMQKGIIKDRQFMAKLEQIGQGGQQSQYQEEQQEQTDQETPSEYEQLKDTTDLTYEQQPLTNKFQGNSPLNLD